VNINKSLDLMAAGGSDQRWLTTVIEYRPLITLGQ
jgi:hypothetical protein